MQVISASAKNSKKHFFLNSSFLLAEKATILFPVLRFLRTYWSPLLVALAILYGSLIRTPHIRMDVVGNMDKLCHMAAYFLLGLTLTRALLRDGVPFLQRALWAVVLPLFYGGVIELLQGWLFAPRTADFMDFLANAAGSLLAYVIVDTAGRAKCCSNK